MVPTAVLDVNQTLFSLEPVAARLEEAGTQVVTMTNGTASITQSFLDREGLTGLVDDVLDVSGAGRWKPDPQAYQHVLERSGAAANDAALVTVHP